MQYCISRVHQKSLSYIVKTWKNCSRQTKEKHNENKNALKYEIQHNYVWEGLNVTSSLAFKTQDLISIWLCKSTKVRLCQKDARAGNMAVGNKHIYMIYFMPNLQIWTKSEVQIFLNCWLTITGKYVSIKLT